MTTAIERAATERALRIQKSISRNGHNGSSPEIKKDEIKTEAIMKEWLEALSKIKETLYALRKPCDKHQPVEDELDSILFVIETAFSFGWGAAPNDLECKLCESGDKSHMETCEKLMLWNYPEFAKIISQRAKSLKITTRMLITRSLESFKDGGENIRQRVLEQLFGREYYTSRLRKFINTPEEQRTRIKENKRVKQRESEERDKFVRVAGRKNI